MSWRCHVCGRTRPDEMISVYQTDISAEHGLAPGTVLQNVRYCLDQPGCVAGVRDFRFFRKGNDEALSPPPR